jgi:sugar phosphate isomerase/epimerase
MKLGAYTACLHDKPVAEALRILRDLGLDSAEINSASCPRPISRSRRCVQVATRATSTSSCSPPPA